MITAITALLWSMNNDLDATESEAGKGILTILIIFSVVTSLLTDFGIVMFLFSLI